MQQAARQIGRYRLGYELGRGGMGVVYAATDTVLGRDVALKLFDVAAASSESAERFRREAQFLARFTHPNIVSVFDFGTDDDHVWLVMERLPGPTLAKLVATTGPLAVDAATSYGRECALALAAVHASGVVHRDLKPSNVMLDADGRCRLLDLGVAKLVSSTSRADLTVAGSIVGTIAYVAPELIAGEAATPAADMYALGVVMFFLLTSRVPFQAETQAAALAQVVAAETPPPSRHRPGLSPSLDNLVVSLLAKEPGQRPTAADVARALAATPAGEAPTAVLAPEITLGPSQRYRSTRWIAWLAVAAALVLGAATAGIYEATLGSPKPEPALTRSVPPTTAAPTSRPSAPVTVAQPTVPGLIAQIRSAISAAVASGGLASGDGQDLSHRLDDIAQSFTQGHPDDTSHKVDDLAHHVDDLIGQGKLSVSDGDQLTTLVARLAAFASSTDGSD